MFNVMLLRPTGLRLSQSVYYNDIEQLKKVEKSCRGEPVKVFELESISWVLVFLFTYFL